MSCAPCAVPLPWGGFNSGRWAGFLQWSPVPPVQSPLARVSSARAAGMLLLPDLPAAWDIPAGHSPAKSGPSAWLFGIWATHQCCRSQPVAQSLKDSLEQQEPLAVTGEGVLVLLNLDRGSPFCRPHSTGTNPAGCVWSCAKGGKRE